MTYRQGRRANEANQIVLYLSILSELLIAVGARPQPSKLHERPSGSFRTFLLHGAREFPNPSLPEKGIGLLVWQLAQIATG